MSYLTCCVCGAVVMVEDDTCGPCVPLNWTVTFRNSQSCSEGKREYFCPQHWPRDVFVHPVAKPAP